MTGIVDSKGPRAEAGDVEKAGNGAPLEVVSYQVGETVERPG
jgi:hypothetical protein